MSDLDAWTADTGTVERAVRLGWQRAARSASRIRSDVPVMLLDAVLAAGAFFVALALRFDARIPGAQVSSLLEVLPVAVVVHVVSYRAWGLYRQMWRQASIAEARRVVLGGGTAGLSMLVLTLVGAIPRLPMSVVLVAPFLTTCLVGSVRFQSRLFAFNRNRARHEPLRVAILGAGDAGASLIRGMQRAPEEGFRPVAAFDDDPRKAGRALAGVPVLGPIEDIATDAGELDIDLAVLAIPSADADLVSRAAAATELAGIPLKVLPPLRSLVAPQVSVQDVRDLRIEDLLGRQQVETDIRAVASLLAGRSVLVTGAGGSIGSEIARQVASFGPARVVMLDHDETHLHDAIAGMNLDVAVQCLADVRDPDQLDRIFARFRPSVVFHAAAHKHVPLLEDHPLEAVRTNVLGTHNVLQAARRHGVERFVFISTDKAVQPSSVMGATKWFGEQLMMAATPVGGSYCAVRFGNVLGSRGSVIPTFTRQIAAGGPVTVTDPEMTRYFMSVQEAVQLVLQAAALARGGDVFMLEMGEPMRIMELAERMISLSGHEVGRDMEIKITGVRPGEKLAEELRTADEAPQPTEHPSVIRLQPCRLPNEMLESALDRVTRFAYSGDDAGARPYLLRLARSTRVADDVIDLTALERGVPAGEVHSRR